MNVHFPVGATEIAARGCIATVHEYASTVVTALNRLRYGGTTRESNSRQLDIRFDVHLLASLSRHGCQCQATPALDGGQLEGTWGNEVADAIVQCGDASPVVIEIEKANKKTMWFDFIKLWMFIDTGQANVGLLLCPTNYAHRHGVWDLFDQAQRYKQFLARFARVPKSRMNRIGIIGYEQQIRRGRRYVLWNREEFRRVKSLA